MSEQPSAPLQSDDDLQTLIDLLRKHSSLRVLNAVECHDVFRVLKQRGYVIHGPPPTILPSTTAAGPYMINQSRKK